MRPHLLSAIEALQFREPATQGLGFLDAAQWNAFLACTDAARLTLALGIRRRDALPESVQFRIDRNLASNRQRLSVLAALHEIIALAFRKNNVEFCVLKGLSHWPYFCDELWHRPQYDVDLLVSPRQIARAWETLLKLGYRPHGRRAARTDHRPPLIPLSGRTWRGDYFDEELAPSIELHFRLWDDSTERFAFPGWESSYGRRVTKDCGGVLLPALTACDSIAFSAMHLLRHLLRGDLKAGHVYELAHFLERSASDARFWHEWVESTPARSRALQSVAFGMAVECYRCNYSPLIYGEFESLPPVVRKWLRAYSVSSVAGLGTGKIEILLHLALCRTTSGRLSVLTRRIVPSRLPDVWKSEKSWSVLFLLSRLLHHILAAPQLVARAVLFWRSGSQPPVTLSKPRPESAVR